MTLAVISYPASESWSFLGSGHCRKQPLASVLGQRLTSAALVCVASTLLVGEASESCLTLLGHAYTWDFEGKCWPMGYGTEWMNNPFS